MRAKDLSEIEQKPIHGDPLIHLVAVRWFDGYFESFEATEVRHGSDLLWLRLTSGQNRAIPLRQVRWFAQSPESHSII
jgi:hypothetical protein